MRTSNTIYILAMSAALGGCITRGEKMNNESELNTYPVLQLSLCDTVLHKNYVADIQAVRNVEIRARVNGFLNKIYVDEGQRVQQGQLLFSLNDEEYRSELTKAKAALSSAIAEAKGMQLELDRVTVLVDKKVIAKSEVEVAKAKLAAANARIEEARSAEANAATRLSYTVIRAPFDGYIDRIPSKTGSLIGEGELLTSVSDIKEVYAYFNVSETEYLQHSRSNKGKEHPEVRLVLADGTDYQYAGKVETIESEFEETTGSIAFRARFPNPQALLKHGASGKVLLSNEMSDAMLLPQKAVFEMQDKNYVFVLDKTNQVKMKNFVPGARLANCYIVQSGLNEGDRVVYEGVRNLRDGMKINPAAITLDSIKAL
ncbi:efflux RND transporter periplasmic adaptor subunit [Chitinophaga rhizophila]|uniref:Efflux RND transporter periplasmic adaptor subunit n=1 Tax=Chitinophaga rhizophila TaxID=2866212 RepID=A0ABS7GKX1_9BACT|nr:efflux RND transporter periplasmic adaptor subunit [Chitinophaga rhizophila]MBW8687825.1 efflux RND transporter periplasmic adaptor subunit [Chitinophaga rhizophila]